MKRDAAPVLQVPPWLCGCSSGLGAARAAGTHLPGHFQSRPGLGTARWQRPINDAHLGHSGAQGLVASHFVGSAKCLLELSTKFL